MQVISHFLSFIGGQSPTEIALRLLLPYLKSHLEDPEASPTTAG